MFVSAIIIFSYHCSYFTQTSLDEEPVVSEVPVGGEQEIDVRESPVLAEADAPELVVS